MSNDKAHYHYTVNTSIPCAEKARELGLPAKWHHLCRRNVEVKLRVTVDKKAVEDGLVQMPDEKPQVRNGMLQIQIHESLRDQLEVELTHQKFAEHGLMSIQYYPIGEAMMRMVVELPVALKEVDSHQVHLPNMIRGEGCVNAALSLQVGNVVGTIPPHQSGGRYGRKNVTQNHRVRFTNQHWFGYYVNRELNPDGSLDEPEIEDRYFWPQTCNLVCTVNHDMQVASGDLVGDSRESNDESMNGAHPNLMQSIYEGRFRCYFIPDSVSRVGRNGRKDLVLEDFPRLVFAWEKQVVSETLPGTDIFLPRTDVPTRFYCCTGVADPVKNQTWVTHAIFGWMPSLYKTRTTWDRGKPRREIVLDRNGEPVLRSDRDRGDLAILHRKQMFQALAALYGWMEHGSADLFFEEHGILLPDTLFTEEDEAERAAYKKAKNAERKAEREAEREAELRAEREARDDTSGKIEEGDSSNNEEPENEEELDVGGFEPMTDDEEESEDSEDSDEEDSESDEEKFPV